jgi:DNA repair exonuclease SbcCD nuclease subunit
MADKKIKFSHDEICCIADLHIGCHQASSIWHKVSLDFAEWLKDKLNKQGIRDIVIAGDVFHDRNEISVQTLQTITNFFNILKDFNIVILVGNHDAYYKDRIDVNSVNILHGYKNIHVASEITEIKAFDRVITFVPWSAKLPDVPEADVMFGHFEIMSFKMNKSKICSHGTSSSDLLSKSRLVMSGHFHYRDERKYQNGTIIYLGSPYQLDFGDCNTSKGIYILNLKTLKYDFIENDLSPKHFKFRLSDVLNNETGTISNLKKLTPGNFVNFLIDKDVHADKVNVLVNKLSSLQPLLIRTEFADIDKYSVEGVGYDFTGVDIPAAIEEFINMLEVENKREILTDTLALYRQVT